MKYMLLVCVDGIPDPEADREIAEKIGPWLDEMDGRGVRLEGHQLQWIDNATSVRVRDGQLVLTDGPFAETKEQIGGLLRARVPRPRRGDRGGRARPGREVRDDRGTTDLGELSSGTQVAVADAFRDEWGRIVAHADHAAPVTGTWPRSARRRPSPRRSSAGRWTGSRGGPAHGSRPSRATGRSTGCAASARVGAAGRGGRRGAADRSDGRGDETRDRGRPAAADLHVLPSGAPARGAGRADAAHARGAHHSRDRARVPRPRSRRWPSASCGPSTRSATPGSRTGAAGAPARRSERPACSRSCTSCSTRATPRPPAPT